MSFFKDLLDKFKKVKAEERLINETQFAGSNLTTVAEPKSVSRGTQQKPYNPILDDLCPKFAATVKAFLDDCKSQGLNVDVNSGLRTFKKQNELYAQGRTKPGLVVTNARGGFSLHNYGLAVDVVFKDEKGNWSWDNKWPWDKLGAIGKKHGLEWGGDWKKPDRPHFQYFNGLKLNQAIKIYKEEGISGVWKEVYK